MQYQSHESYAQEEAPLQTVESPWLLPYGKEGARRVVQGSLMDIFNEFTVVIAGELTQLEKRESGQADFNIQA